MPTTHIQSLRSIKTRLDYVAYGSGPEGTERRRNHDATRPLAFSCDLGTREEMTAVAERLRATYPARTVEGYEVRVSWSREELVPENADDVARAMEFANALARELFPDTPCAITAHGDGVGKCLHVHMDFLNVRDLETGHSLSGNGRNHQTVAAIADTLAREREMDVVRHASHEGVWAERREELETAIDDSKEKLGDGEKWPRSLRDNVVALAIGDVIDETIRTHAREISSVGDLKSYLADAGVEVIEKHAKDGEVGFTYKMEVELEGKTRGRRCKASKISREYSADRVMDTIAAEAQAQIAAEEARRAQLAAEAEARRLADEAEAARKAEEEAERRAEKARLAAEEAARKDAEEAEARRREFEESARLAAEREKQARLALERQLAGAVTVRQLPEKDGWSIALDERAVGIGDKTRAIAVRDKALIAHANAAHRVMNEEDWNAPLTEELLRYKRKDTRSRFGDMPKQIADAVADEMRDGVNGKWDERPTTFWGWFERGFRLAMERSKRDPITGEERVGVKTVLLGMLGRTLTEQSAYRHPITSLAERARSVLERLGVVRKRTEPTRTQTPQQPTRPNARQARSDYISQISDMLSKDMPQPASQQPSVVERGRQVRKVPGFDPAHGAGAPVRRSAPAVDVSRTTNFGEMDVHERNLRVQEELRKWREDRGLE